MGWIAQFLSKAVVTGFLAGAAIDVVIGELPKLTGTSAEGTTRGGSSATWLGALGDIHWTTLLVGAVALGVILGAAVRWRPRFPARSCWWSAGCSRRRYSTSARTGSRSSATCRAGFPPPELPDLASSGTTSRRS